MKVNEIDFVDKDADTIKNDIITVYEALAGRTLAQGDPIKLFLLAVADIIVQQRALIDYAAKMNLVYYATGDFLDHIGLLVGCTRIDAAYATTELKFTLSAVRESNTTIPKGTRATADSEVFFAADSVLVIPAGELSGSVNATATVTGEAGNKFAIGEINAIVDPVPFVESVENITVSDGGGDVEEDEAYRERIIEAPEKYSTAGPAGAYIYHVKAVSTLIEDVAVDTPKPGYVNIYPLMTGGELPSTEMLKQIKESISFMAARPLTDFVSILSPEKVDYNVNLTYYIDNDDATQANAIKESLAGI